MIDFEKRIFVDTKNQMIKTMIHISLYSFYETSRCRHFFFEDRYTYANKKYIFVRYQRCPTRWLYCFYLTGGSILPRWVDRYVDRSSVYSRMISCLYNKIYRNSYIYWSNNHQFEHSIMWTGYNMCYNKFIYM